MTLLGDGERHDHDRDVCSGSGPAVVAVTGPPDTGTDVGIHLDGDAGLGRGYLTTEWWTTVVGAALSTVLALIGIHGAAAAQAIAIGAPVLLAGTYAVSRSMHKSHLADLVADALPQASRPV